MSVLPEPAKLAEYAVMRNAMSAISKWIFMPSLVITLIAGLLAIAVTRGFQDAGWVWAKLATGILLFESGLTGIQGPIQREAERSADAIAGHFDLGTLGTSLTAERNTLWIFAALSTANVILGVWRPRFIRQGRQSAAPSSVVEPPR
jgi:hypothetical protein